MGRFVHCRVKRGKGCEAAFRSVV